MKRLTRSRSNRMVAGVLGGLAHYFQMDVTLLRLIFVAVLVFTAVGPGLLAYFVAMFVMPLEERL